MAIIKSLLHFNTFNARCMPYLINAFMLDIYIVSCLQKVLSKGVLLVFVHKKLKIYSIKIKRIVNNNCEKKELYF